MLASGGRTSNSLLKRRVSRKEEAPWAVSYADMLMVLLSFFIVFFSSDPKSVLHVIADDLKATPAVKPSVETPISSVLAPNPTATAAGENPQASQAIKDLSLEIPGSVLRGDLTPQELLVDLKDNIYKVAGYSAPKAELNQIIEKIEPHQDEVTLLVIGHTDSLGYSGKNNLVINDNLSLAGLRASRAAQYIQSRLPRLHIKIEGSAQSTRGTRSLTLILQRPENQRENK